MTTEPIRKLAAIMFTDMVGYTSLMNKDEARAKKLRDRHREVLESTITSHRGETIQYYGDGTLSIFDSAKEAVVAAVAIQRNLQLEPKVPLRIGIHIGDIVYDHEGIYGDGVNLASRIESLSVPGAVLISEMVHNEIKNHLELKTQSLGTFNLKNVRKPVEVFAMANEGIIVPSPDAISGKTEPTPDKTIAVLPLHNMSLNPENEYFGNGISEEIINLLAKVDGLSVISRGSSFRITRGEDIRAIGSKLAATHVLEGSVRKAANRVRVSVQLISTIDGHQLWSQVFDRELDNIFEVQDEIARQVLNKMRESFDINSQSKSVLPQPTQNTEAYNAYLKGLHHFNKWNPDSVQKAVSAFEEATKLDPEFPSPYSSLSNCYSFLGSCGAISPIKAYSQAHEYALQATEKNADLAESHLALAMIKFFHFWDWEGARKSLEKAAESGLDSGLMNQIQGLYLTMVGKGDEAIEKMERAVHLDPVSLPMLFLLGNMYFFDEQYEKAIDLYDQVLDLDPAFRSALETKGAVLLCLGKNKEAIEALHAYHDMVGDPLKGIGVLGMAYGFSGQKETALTYLERIATRKRNEPESSLEIDFAMINIGLGEFDKALEYLNQVFEKRFGIVCTGMIFIVRCPVFKKLWQESSFRDLLQKLKLE